MWDTMRIKRGSTREPLKHKLGEQDLPIKLKKQLKRSDFGSQIFCKATKVATDGMLTLDLILSCIITCMYRPYVCVCRFYLHIQCKHTSIYITSLTDAGKDKPVGHGVIASLVKGRSPDGPILSVRGRIPISV